MTVGGTVGNDTIVCADNNSGVLVLTGHLGNVLQWEFSMNDGVNWGVMSGVSPVNNFSNVTTKTLFRALVQNGTCGSSYSQYATVDVIKEAKGGRVIGSNPDPNYTVCAEDNQGEMKLVDYKGNIDHWEYSRDAGATWLEDFNTTPDYTYLNVPTTTWYRAVVKGCSSVDTSEIYVLNVSYDACDKLIIANLLTPNNDGRNDTWLIEDIENYPRLSVMIFNRFGKEIYKNDQYDNSWDGTFEGKPLQDGTYYYIMRMEGKDEVLKGAINLMK